MALLSREQILKAQDLRKEELEIPEWGGSVLIWEMSGKERDAWERERFSIKGTDKTGKPIIEWDISNGRSKLAARCLKDENGKRLFSDKDMLTIGEKSATILDRIVKTAKKVNAIDDESVREVKAELEENPTGDSSGSSALN